MDGDAHLDLLTPDPSPTASTSGVGAYPMGLVLADLDGLCGPDIAVTGKDSGDVFVIRSR